MCTVLSTVFRQEVVLTNCGCDAGLWEDRLVRVAAIECDVSPDASAESEIPESEPWTNAGRLTIGICDIDVSWSFAGGIWDLSSETTLSS